MPTTAQQPKWQDSCSKMWSIEQLYIELGLGPKLAGFYADFTQIFEVGNLYMGFKRILQYFYAGYTEKIR